MGKYNFEKFVRSIRVKLNLFGLFIIHSFQIWFIFTDCIRWG